LLFQVVAQKTKPSEKEKKATQGATSTTTRPPVSDKAAAHGDKSQKPQTGLTADRKKPLAIRIAPANKDETKGTKKDANEERPVKDARGPTGERRRPVGERSDRVVGTRGRGMGAPITGTAGRLARGGAAGGIERAGATTTRTTPTRTAASAKLAGSGPVKRTPLQSNRRKAVSPNKQVKLPGDIVITLILCDATAMLLLECWRTNFF
uniref:Translation initiation factor IF-2 n=1 Tax=Anisakis simplex TaxID=6269 RepID=A0A0M3JGT2_ANISI